MLGASFAAGVFAADVLALPLKVCVVCCAAVSLVAFVSARVWGDGGWASWFVLVAFVWAGAALAVGEKELIGRERVRRFYEEGRIGSGEPVELTGVLERAPEWSPEGFRLRLRAERLGFKREERAASGSVGLFLPVRVDERRAFEISAREEYGRLELRRGARVRVLVALERAERFRNPGGDSYVEYLNRQGLDAAGWVKSPLLFERLDDEPVLLPLAWLDAARSWTLERVNLLFTRDTAGVLNAALLGSREGLSRATAERFREGGTFHVLVISGMHITFVGGLAWWLARLLTRRRAWRFAWSAFVVWAYVLAVGAEVSVARAALMFTAVALAPVLHRRAAGLNALGGAALALLAWRPSSLFDPSFQLTFLSVLLIVAVAWPLLANLKAVGEWRPTVATPHPPVCPGWWKTLGETLFWSEKNWRREMSRATYSYVLFKSALPARLERWRVQRALRYAFAAALVSACVQAGMLPLFAVHFHRFPLAALPLNVFVGAGVAALSLLALAAVALAQLSSSSAAPLVWAVERAAWVLEHSVDPFTSAGATGLRLAEYAEGASAVYALYYVPLLVLIFALARWRPVGPAPEPREEETNTLEQTTGHRTPRGLARKVAAKLFTTAGTSLFGNSVRRRDAKYAALRLSALVLAALFVLIVAHPLSEGRAGGVLRVDFLDVGQGDAALLTMPDGSTLLVDGGGRPRLGADEQETFEPDRRTVGEAVVSEYLWRRGLGRVDYVLATHADADHIDGLRDVVNNFRVRAALVARAPGDDEEFRRFALAAEARGVPVYLVGRGDALEFGAVAVEVLWPPRVSHPSSAPSNNDDSIVLRVRYGRTSVLLTGDIEARAETALLAAREDLRADVVKVAHHGSRTSSTREFVAATSARLAVVPVGQDSPHGHPHAEVVERWRASGTQILTTGACGTISVTTDGDDVKVETYLTGESCKF